ncbi:Kinesin-4 [Drechslerella dactyloides]|uniref:Kinesin-like protein n=1 Tax=Drechslerella dactyloides TaxID=74499 RepID=A0AAD6NJT8_DREDA|nr:Kinesin-4 [Drechslerella dactyloides]
MPPKTAQKLAPFDVYVRWRPLPDEPGTTSIEKSTAESGDYQSVSISQPASSSSSSRGTRSWSSAASFTRIFEPTDDNKAVFDDVVSQAFPRILAGKTCNFFAYGHTGSGKTHTIVGYDHSDPSQTGLSLAAARALFDKLAQLNESLPPDADRESERLAVGLRMYEVRKKSAFDLLNGRTECHVREGPDGKTHVRGETESLEGGKVRVRPILIKPCFTYDSLLESLEAGLALRATGTSTVHDKSSRTHAVFELEIVNNALINARDAVIERHSELVPHGKHATDVYLAENSKGYIVGPDGKYMLNPDYTIDQARIDAAEATKREYEERLEAAEAHVQQIFASSRHPCLGGKFVFVDLAGSEYYDQKASSSAAASKQTAEERQEGRQINSDLFALKEVIRARSSGQARIPFRSSPLTMVLREHFLGSEGGFSAMILTVSPAAEQYAATMNTVKYGNLVGMAGGEK